MSKIITLIVNPNQTCLVNNYSKRADENGIIKINVDEVMIPESKGLIEFDYEAENTYGISKVQRIAFYEIVSTYTQISKAELRNCLQLDKEDVDRLVGLACRYKVLVKTNSQWKALADMREKVKRYALHLNTEYGEAENTSQLEEDHKKNPSFTIKDEDAPSEESIPVKKKRRKS